MTQFLADTVLDVALNHLKNNVTKLILCDASPATYADATTNNGTGTGVRLGEVTVESGDFTLADHTPGGRKVTVAAKSATLSAAGDGSHVAWVDVTNTAVLKVLPLDAVLTGLPSSGTVNLPSHFHAFLDAEDLPE